MSICYDVNGVQVDAIPCYNSSATGQCCEPGDECLSIGTCSPGPGRPNTGESDTYRATGCTDPLWQTDKCFSGCNAFGGNGLQACGNESYCCYDYDGCNCAATSLFDLGVATIVTSLPVSSSTTTPASVSASASSTAPSSASSSASRTAAPATSTSTPRSGDDSNTIALGAGLGVGLGVAFILGILAAIWFFRRRKSAKRPQDQSMSLLYLDSKNELEAHEKRRLAELPSTPQRAELDAMAQEPRVLGGPRAELPS